MSRRAHDRIVSCLACGDVLGIYEDGLSGPPPFLHACAVELNRYDLEDTLDEIREGKGEVHD